MTAITVGDSGVGDDSIDTSADVSDARSVMRIVSGNPTDEQVAVLVALFAGAAAGSPAVTDEGPRNSWGCYDDGVRSSSALSPGAFTNRGGW